MKRIPFLAGLLLWTGPIVWGEESDNWALEVIEEPVPMFDIPFVRVLENTELPELRGYLSRDRYWAEDGHLDIVVLLSNFDADEALVIRIVSTDGEVLDENRWNELPGLQVALYPRIPEALLHGGAGIVEIEVDDGSGVRVAKQLPFRVERYGAGEPLRDRVSLTIPNETGLRQRGVPVEVGVPFPRGGLSSVDNLRLVNERGEEIGLQVEETARWSKWGPVKWVLCSFTVDLEGEPLPLYLEYGSEVERRMDGPLVIDDSGDGFPRIDVGRLRWDGGLWYDVSGAGDYRLVLDGAALGSAYIEHEDGRIYRAEPAASYQLEDAGPERVVIKREGWYREVEGDRNFCRNITRWVLYRDSPVVRVMHTWIFTGDGNRDRIASMGWEFPLTEGFGEAKLLTGFGESGEWMMGDALLQWDYEHFDIISDGQIAVFEGGRAPGVVMVEDDVLQVYLGVRDFWQNYPSELEFADGSLWFHNWPRHNRLAGFDLDKVLSMDRRGMAPLPSAQRYAEEDAEQLYREEWVLTAIQARYAHEGAILDFRLPGHKRRSPSGWVSMACGCMATSRHGVWIWQGGRSRCIGLIGADISAGRIRGCPMCAVEIPSCCKWRARPRCR